MLKGRQGFTLIELLIVIVIIGILAAIAIPKFGKTREKAYFKAMQSDLRNLSSQQEVYYSNPANNYQYAVDVAISGMTGWGATAAHQALATNQTCALFQGTVSTIPAPASTQGLVACTNE